MTNTSHTNNTHTNNTNVQQNAQNNQQCKDGQDNNGDDGQSREPIFIIGSISKPETQTSNLCLGIGDDDLNPEYSLLGMCSGGLQSAIIDNGSSINGLNNNSTQNRNGLTDNSQIKQSLSTAIQGNDEQGANGGGNSKDKNAKNNKKYKHSNKYNIGQQLEQARASPDKSILEEASTLQNSMNPHDPSNRHSLLNATQLTEQQHQIDQINEQQASLYKEMKLNYHKRKLSILLRQKQASQMQITQDTITGKMTMMKQLPQRFINFELVSVDFYDIFSNFPIPEEILQLIKSQKSVQYDFSRKTWVLDLNSYGEVLQQVRLLVEKKNISVYEIPILAFDLIDNPIPFSSPHIKSLVSYDYKKDNYIKPRIGQLPQQLQRKLYNFQKVGVQFGIDHYGRLLLGDEMGVGKTVQAISLSYLYQRDWPVLIISPSSLKYSWRDELMKWLEPEIKFSEICVIFKENQEFVSSEINFYIISYSLAWKMSELLSQLNFKVVIVDEAHYLKSRESKRSQHLLPIIMRCKRIMLLSGTPMLGRPNEIYNLLKILRPDVFRSFKEFGSRYCNPKETIFGVDWTGQSNMIELNLLLKKCLMIRRLKSEVLFELPAKRRQKIVVNVDERSQRKISKYLKQVKKWEYKIEEDFQELDKMDKLQASEVEDKYSYLLRAYTLTGMAKLKGIQQFIDTLIDGSVKFLLFAHHYDVLDQLEDYIVKKSVSYIRIDGRIDNKKRHEAVKKYQSDNKCQVALLSLTASSQGITLTAASIVVFAEMNWTPGIMVQAEDRAHRIGQTSSVLVYYIYGEGTLDKLIYPRLQVKSEVISTIVDGQRKNQFKMDTNKENGENNGEYNYSNKRRANQDGTSYSIDQYDYKNDQSDWSGDDDQDPNNEDNRKQKSKSRKNQLSSNGLIENQNNDGMPVIPELMQYNDRFEDCSKRKIKERQKIYDVFEKIKYGKQKLELQQTNIKDFFFNQRKNGGGPKEVLEDYYTFNMKRSQSAFSKMDTLSVNDFNSISHYNGCGPSYYTFEATQRQDITVPQEEDGAFCEDGFLPKPPLFPDYSHQYNQIIEKPKEKPQEASTDSENDEDNLNHNKWKAFNQLRQKKKQIMKEQNPYQTIKIPPPPPMKQMGMFGRSRKRLKFKNWLRRRKFYKGKTLKLVGSQDKFGEGDEATTASNIGALDNGIESSEQIQLNKNNQHEFTQFEKRFSNTQQLNTLTYNNGDHSELIMSHTQLQNL